MTEPSDPTAVLACKREEPCPDCAGAAPILAHRILQREALIERLVTAVMTQHVALSSNKRLPHNLCSVCDFIVEAKAGAP